jgi:hypothetical protein
VPPGTADWFVYWQGNTSVDERAKPGLRAEPPTGGNFPGTLAGRLRLWSDPMTHPLAHAPLDARSSCRFVSRCDVELLLRGGHMQWTR